MESLRIHQLYSIAPASFWEALDLLRKISRSYDYGGQYWTLLNVGTQKQYVNMNMISFLDRKLSLATFFSNQNHDTAFFNNSGTTLLTYSHFWISPTIHLVFFVSTCTTKPCCNLHLIFVLQLNWKRCWVSSWVGLRGC